MLPRSESVMIIEVVAATGWQPHNRARRARRGAEQGNWDLDLGSFDENDGAAQLTVFVNDVAIDSFVWDQNLGNANATKGTRAVHAIDGVELETGDVIRISGTPNASEAIRVDFLDLAYVDDLV